MSLDKAAITLDFADWGRGGTVRLGVVNAFDARACRVRVCLAGDPRAQDGSAVLTGWLPWATWAAGHLRVWSPPAEGEQCLVLSPSGDFAQAVAVPAAFQQKGPFPAPSDNIYHTLLIWDDGGYIRYERDVSDLYIYVPRDIHIQADRDIYIEAARDIHVQAGRFIRAEAGDSMFLTAQNLVKIWGARVEIN